MVPLPAVMSEARIVAIARHVPLGVVAKGAAELIDAGLPVVEITLDSEDALESIAHLRAEFGENLCLGAGTALTPQAARLAVDEDIEFLVSPVTDEAVAKVAHEHSVAYIPGAATATEVWRASKLGAAAVKLFPFDARQADTVKAIRSVLPDIPLMCTGGIDDRAVGPLLGAGASVLGIGTWLWVGQSDRFADRVARLAAAIRQHEQGGWE